MRTQTFLATIWTLQAIALAHDVHNFLLPRQENKDEFPGEEPKARIRNSITQSAALGCATGESGKKYLACSSSISSMIDECADEDVGCACDLAGEGFGCLQSHCPTHTPALCAASALLSRFCAPYSEPYPTLTDFTCPTGIENIVNSIIATELGSEMPSGLVSVLKGPEETGTGTASKTGGTESSSVAGVEIPGPTGGASGLELFGGVGRAWGKEGDPVRRVLGLGVCVAVLVAGLGGLL